MNFLLKIVEGPNRGAEIALPDGVAVTLGKGDDCDVVLADASLPAAPTTLRAAPDGVTLDGQPLEPFAVKTLGATSFAVGPADAPWEPLKVESSKVEGSERPEVPETPESPEAPEHSETLESPAPRPRRRGCLGCLAALLLLFVALAAALWFLRDNPRVVRLRDRFAADRRSSHLQPSNLQPSPSQSSTLAALAARHGVSLDESAGRAVLRGDFATRAERLAATAEAYAVSPGIELDFADAESLRTAAEDTFALLGEKDLRVEAATNRVLVLSGRAADLRGTLEALAADLPKLRDVDVAGVSATPGVSQTANPGHEPPDAGRADGASRGSRLTSATVPSLPVCGILTAPYPCLVLRNGTRVMEGAPLGDSVVLKIEADAVTITNATGRFTWKP